MNENRRNIAVIGAGSWGTALGNLLAEKGFNVDLWVREDDVFHQIRKERENKVFLPGIRLSDGLNAVNSYEEALLGKELVLIVVPSHVFRKVLREMKPYVNNGMSLITATKGIENESLEVMSGVASAILGNEYLEKFSCLSGPSFAKEVVRRLPTAVTIACRDAKHAKRMQEVFYTEHFRVYVSDDIMGVQLGGALKNVVAIAAGASDGLRFGYNARAALITRGLAEISRLGVSMGANPLTFAGLAGMGDLVLTCTGDLSRNRSVGIKIGEGMSIEEITGRMKMVAEGVKTTKSAFELGRKMGVDMPIINQVYNIIYEKKKPEKAVRDLMKRKLKAEIES